MATGTGVRFWALSAEFACDSACPATDGTVGVGDVLGDVLGDADGLALGVGEDAEVDETLAVGVPAEMGGPWWCSFAAATAPMATAATAIPATAGTHRGNTGTMVRVPDMRAGASGLGGSAVSEKGLGSGRPSHTRRAWTATGTSAT